MDFTRRKFIVASAAVAITSLTAFALPNAEEPQKMERASIVDRIPTAITPPVITADPNADISFPREGVTSLPAPEPEPEPEPTPEPSAATPSRADGEPSASTPVPQTGASASQLASASLAPVPTTDVSVTASKEFARTLLASKGFGPQEFVCLDNLWERESNWNHTADNPYSDAYGIPQSLPGNKMAAFGEDWETNPQTQIKWGISYIEGRYGSPCNAWGHSETVGWY